MRLILSKPAGSSSMSRLAPSALTNSSSPSRLTDFHSFSILSNSSSISSTVGYSAFAITRTAFGATSSVSLTALPAFFDSSIKAVLDSAVIGRWVLTVTVANSLKVPRSSE